MTSEADERAMSAQLVWAAVDENVCSVPAPFSPRWMIPPKRKQNPITRSKLDNMEPSIDDWTTSIWPSFNAIILIYYTCQHRPLNRNVRNVYYLTITSTALPRVALSHQCRPLGFWISPQSRLTWHWQEVLWQKNWEQRSLLNPSSAIRQQYPVVLGQVADLGNLR